SIDSSLRVRVIIVIFSITLIFLWRLFGSSLRIDMHQNPVGYLLIILKIFHINKIKVFFGSLSQNQQINI
ncbi:hypothetical protein ACWLP4_003867, partial [Vibrio vulnificus]